MRKILLVDDDPQALESTRKILELSGYAVTTAGDGQAALDLVRALDAEYDLVLTDVRMPRLGGLEFLRALSLCGERTPVILMTAFGRVEDAVWAMKLGAVDFLTKPFKRQPLLSAVELALKRACRSVEGKGAESTHLLLGSSPQMRELRASIQQIAPVAATVLITGESGTGKELVASCLHRQSPRASGPFIPLNCAAIPEQLLESELFGFERGSFTGATSAKQGLFEAANGGTLLLDEIGDMPLSLQGKLLRTLQESEVRRIGSTASRKVDVRVLAATHRDLKESVRAGTFRQDLLFRLEVIGLEIPSLRTRKEDVVDLANHFLRESGRRHGKNLKAIEDEAMQILLAHEWPGNVRELSNVIERAVVFARAPFEVITTADLPPHLVTLFREKAALRGDSQAIHVGARPEISVPIGTPLKDVEELLIRKTLEATAGDKNMTARLLGINSRTIYRKLDKRSEES